MASHCKRGFGHLFPGILARKNESDLADMKQQNYQLIRLV